MMLPILSNDAPNGCKEGAKYANVALLGIPNRSKSCDGLSLRLVVRVQKPLRSRSSPALRGNVGDKMTSSNCSTVPPPLCRWSSAPPREQMVSCGRLKNRFNMAPSMPLSSMRSLPPRLPRRKSGKAEELLSALPPRVPERKPGMAHVDARALPPGKPQRFYFDDSCDNFSLISSLSMDSSSRSDDADDHSVESAHVCFGAISSDGRVVRQNLRQVLGEVLDSLADEACDF